MAPTRYKKTNVTMKVAATMYASCMVSTLWNTTGGSGMNIHVVTFSMQPLRFTAPPTRSDSRPSERMRGVSNAHAVGPDR